MIYVILRKEGRRRKEDVTREISDAADICIAGDYFAKKEDAKQVLEAYLNMRGNEWLTIHDESAPATSAETEKKGRRMKKAGATKYGINQIDWDEEALKEGYPEFERVEMLRFED